MLTKVGKMMRLGPPESASQCNFAIYKIPDGGGPHPKIEKKSHMAMSLGESEEECKIDHL